VPATTSVVTNFVGILTNSLRDSSSKNRVQRLKWLRLVPTNDIGITWRIDRCVVPVFTILTRISSCCFHIGHSFSLLIDIGTSATTIE